MSTSSTTSLVQIIVAIFLPPVAVFMDKGLKSEFWISLILTALFFIPGMIYSLWVVTR